MKKIYYQKDKQKLIAVSAKKIKNHQILAKDYNDAEIKLLKKHLVLTRTIKKNLERLFSSSKNNLIGADVINGWLGYAYKSILTFVNKNRIRILGVISIMGITNYLFLNWIKTNITHLSFRFANYTSISSSFMKLSLISVVVGATWLLFLIPKKKYNVISLFFIIVVDLIYFWKAKDLYIYFDPNNTYVKVGKSVIENVYFLTSCLLTNLVISFIVFNILDEIYKWLVGTNKRIEAPKLTLIWTIIAFLLGLLWK